MPGSDGQGISLVIRLIEQVVIVPESTPAHLIDLSVTFIQVMKGVFQDSEHGLVQIPECQCSDLREVCCLIPGRFDLVCNEDDFLQNGHIRPACRMPPDCTQDIFISDAILLFRKICTKLGMQQVLCLQLCL